MGKRKQTGRKCFTCQYFDIESAKDKAGRVSHDIGVKCLCEFPPIPQSYSYVGTPIPHFVDRDDGDSCSCWKQRGVSGDPTANGKFKKVIEKSARDIAQIMDNGDFCACCSLERRNSKYCESDVVSELSEILEAECKMPLTQNIRAIEKLHECLMKHFKYSSVEKYNEAPIRELLGHSFWVLKEVHDRFVRC